MRPTTLFSTYKGYTRGIIDASLWRLCGDMSMWQIGLPLPIVRITWWKDEGGNASIGRYLGTSPECEYV